MKKSYKEYLADKEKAKNINESYRKVFRSYDYVDIKNRNLLTAISELCERTSTSEFADSVELAIDNALLLAGMLRELCGYKTQGTNIDLTEFEYINNATENVIIFEISLGEENINYHLVIDLKDEKLTVTKENHSEI